MFAENIPDIACVLEAMGKTRASGDAGFCRLLVWQKVKYANHNTITNLNTNSIPNTNPNLIPNPKPY